MNQYIAEYTDFLTIEKRQSFHTVDGVKYGYRSKNSNNLLEMYINTRQEGFGEEVKRRIMLGTFVLSSGYYDAYYLKGQKVRTLIKQDFENAFNKCDVIVAPNSPITAFKLKERIDDPIKMYLSDIYTISANLAGIPGISIPCGISKTDRMPIGLQLMGKHFDEESLIAIGHRFQQTTNHHLQQPPL